MADVPAVQREASPGKAAARPLLFFAGFVLALAAGAMGHDSDGLAMDVAIFFLATLDPWRPK